MTSDVRRRQILACSPVTKILHPHLMSQTKVFYLQSDGPPSWFNFFSGIYIISSCFKLFRLLILHMLRPSLVKLGGGGGTMLLSFSVVKQLDDDTLDD